MGVVTVIIPTLNRKVLLLEALESAFAQTYHDYEILVIDDGSTDGTHDALSSYGDRLRYVWKNNGGEASARNRGILEAGTAYIAFLDSDDLWDPTFLETTIMHLERNPTLGLVSTGCVFFPDEKRRPRIRKRLLQGDLFPLLFCRNFITASAVVVRRDCFRQVGMFNESLELGVDYDMWLRIAKAYPIAFLNQPLCRWRRHNGNISASELRHRQLVLDVVAKHYDPSRISRSSYNLRRSRLIGSLGRAHLRSGDIGQAQACFREAIRVAPWRLRTWKDSLTALIVKVRESSKLSTSRNGDCELSPTEPRIKDHKGIRWIGRQIRHRVDPGASILCYHRIGDIRSDPHSLNISVENFAQQMERLSRIARPIQLSQLVEEGQRGTIPRGAVAVTFDDGYASVLHHAIPILEQHGIPATIFITSGYLGSDREIWSDELEQLLLQPGDLPDHLSLVIENIPIQWKLEGATTYTGDDVLRYRSWTMDSRHDPTPRHGLFRLLHARLLPLPAASRLRILDQLIRWSGLTPMIRPTHRFLSPEQLRRLAEGIQVEIGAHSASHPVLPKMPVQRQEDEIVRCRTALEDIVAKRIRSFAYPYGARSSVTIEIVKQAGFECACTTFPDVIFKGADRYQLPRTHVGNWDPQTFERKLGLWRGMN